jgi:predicted dehydrogenase
MPAYKKVVALIRDGEIGKVQYLQSNFSFFNDWGEDRRLYNKKLAGGATYDVGIYNLSLAFDMLGENPNEIRSIGDLTSSGVDKSCASVLGYGNGRLASLHCGFRLDTDHKATIFGSEGWIEMELHWKVQRFKINRKGKGTEEFDIPFMANGYAHEIIEAVDCIRAGKIESNLISHKTSMNLAKAMDNILEDIGYK